jgi:thiamine biosynthesis protein ThiS
MDVIIGGKKINVNRGSTVSDVLTAIKINPETVLVKKGKSLVPHDEILADGDALELITVISGG